MRCCLEVYFTIYLRVCQFVGIESVIFGTFTIVIFLEQVQSVMTGRTGIDTLKIDEECEALSSETFSPAEKRDKQVRLRDTMGGRCGPQWLLPTRVRHQSALKSVTDLDRSGYDGTLILGRRSTHMCVEVGSSEKR